MVTPNETTEHPWEKRQDGAGAGAFYISAGGVPVCSWLNEANVDRIISDHENVERLLGALERIANDDESLACSDIPNCQGIGTYGHAEDCAVEIARAAIAAARGAS